MRVVRNALLLDLDAPGAVRGPLDIEVDAGRIVRVAPTGTARRGAAPGDVIDADRMLAIPGLVNAHLHSTGLFNRGVLANLPLEHFMLWEVPPVDATATPPELLRTQVLVGAVEMLKRGITSVFDDPIYSPAVTRAGVDAVMGAYRDAGIRATVGIYQPNKPTLEWFPYLADTLPADVRERIESQPLPTTAEILDSYRWFVDRWHGAEGGRLRCAASCSAPQRATDDYMLALHELAGSHDLPFVLHVYESKVQRVTGELLYGGSLVRHIRDIGLLDERTVIVHAVWIDDQDIGDIARSGAVVVHSPAGNLRCGSGVMPLTDLRQAGVTVALCTDEATVEEASSMWNVGRLAGQLHTITTPDYTAWPTPREILRAMTVAGARALGLAGEVGALAEGERADLALLDLSASPHALLADLPRYLVYQEDGRSIRMVMVDGEIVVQDGRVLTVDQDGLLADARAMLPGWLESLRSAEGWADRLRPYYDDMHRRCAGTDVGFTRLLDPGR